MVQTRSPHFPILFVDDESAWLESFSLLLERECGLDHLICSQDSREVISILERQPVSLVLLDLVMPHFTGDQLLPEIAAAYPDVPVIILTGMDQVDAAVRCIKAGAYDYFVKTSEPQRLVAGVMRALRHTEMQQVHSRLRTSLFSDSLQHPEVFSSILTQSPLMHAAFKYIEAVAAGAQPVLITGESGTGKELFAEAVHRIGRPDCPWVPVNVAGLDDNVFSDTLFGHIRGAFTGADRPRPGMIEQAAGGTLFLDEIGDLAPTSQVKLLRLLQSGEYLPLGADRPRRSSARIVAATNQALDEKVNSGAFRRDLYFRLKTHRVDLPPLRKRTEDIPLLLDHFLAEAATELGKKKPALPKELSHLLGNHPFSGNVRELRAMAFEALSHHQGRVLSMACFKQAMGSDAELEADSDDGHMLRFPERLPSIQEAVDQLVQEALARAGGNQGIAANLLGISRPALNKRIRKKTECSAARKGVNPVSPA